MSVSVLLCDGTSCSGISEINSDVNELRFLYQQNDYQSEVRRTKAEATDKRSNFRGW